MALTPSFHCRMLGFDPWSGVAKKKKKYIYIYPDAGKDWGQEEKGTTEDEMDGWHH